MCDIIALAFQTDRTRIATLLLTNNLSGQVYPFLGLNVDHHNYSHGWQNKEFASITRFWVEQYAYLVRKLDSMQEGDGTVLDNSCIMLANEQWTAHSAPKIPLLMSGSLSGALQTGRTLDYESASGTQDVVAVPQHHGPHGSDAAGVRQRDRPARGDLIAWSRREPCRFRDATFCRDTPGGFCAVDLIDKTGEPRAVRHRAAPSRIAFPF